MRDFNEENLTEAVVDRFTNTPDPRLKAVMTSLVRHLHEFVRDVDLTFDEWMYGIEFLTRTGKLCVNSRQEFILLSDTLGVSMLVDAINHRAMDGTTATTVLGPFYVEDPPSLPLGYDLGKDQPGEILYVEGDITSVSGVPLQNAVIDVWQADDDGYYDIQLPDLTEPALRGRFRTDADGRFYFWSILPSSYPIPADGTVGDMLTATARHPWRPAHMHFMISANGYEKLVTHVFVDHDKYLDSDAVFGVKNSLIGDFTEEDASVAPDGRVMNGPWRKLVYHFGLKQASESNQVDISLVNI